MIHIGLELSGRQILTSIDDLSEEQRANLRRTIELVQKIIADRIPALTIGLLLGGIVSVICAHNEFGPHMITNMWGLVIFLTLAITAFSYSLGRILYERKVSAWVKELSHTTEDPRAELFLRESLEADRSGTLRRELETHKSGILARIS